MKTTFFVICILCIMLSNEGKCQIKTSQDNNLTAFWKSFQNALSKNDTILIKSLTNFPIIYNYNGEMKTINKNQLFTECSHIFSGTVKEEMLKVTSLEKVTYFSYNKLFKADKDYKLKDFSFLYRVWINQNFLSLYFTKFQGEIKLFAIETYWRRFKLQMQQINLKMHKRF